MSRVRSGSVRFVGRSAEIGLVRTLVDAVVAGRGGSVLVEGEAGIGKSALLLEGLDGAAGSGCRVCWCKADPSWERMSLRVLSEGLGLEAGELAGSEALPGSTGAGDPVPAMVERLLAHVDRLCAETPVVIVLDDLQWADEASLLAWGRLSRSVVQVPLLLLAAGRPVPRRSEGVRLRRGLVDRGTRVVSLGPLPDADMAELVSVLVGARVGPGLRHVAAQAGGNPLFVREALEGLRRADRVRVAEGLADVVGGGSMAPASLAEAIGGRLRILSPDTVPIVRSAALLGTEFAVVDLATVLGVAVTRLSAGVAEAVAAGVLVESGTELAFAHPLIRQSLYESVSESEREQLHRGAARALAAVGAQTDRVAQQLLAVAGRLDDWVADWLDRQASTLTARAPQVSAELLDRAVQALPAEDPRWEPLATSLVLVLRLLGRYDEVIRIARPVWDRSTDPARIGQVASVLAYTLAATGQVEECLAVTEQTLTRLAQTDGWTARVRGVRALQLAIVGRVDEGTEAAKQAIAEGERVRDRYAVSFGLHALADLAHHRDLREALAIIDRALAVAAEDPESDELRLMLHANRIMYRRRLALPAQAESAIRESLAVAERMNSRVRVMTRTTTAIYYYFHGGWSDAVAELDAVPELMDESPHADRVKAIVHGLRALIAGHQGDQANLDTHLGAASGLEPSSTPDMRDQAEFLLLARALAAERAGHPDRALATLAQILQPEFATDMGDRADCLPTLVRLALAVGDRHTAEAATRACLDNAERDPEWRNTAAADRCQGLLGGEPARLRGIADGYRGAGQLADLAATLEDLAVLSAEQGEADQARAAYVEAVEIYLGMGAIWDIRRTEARLRPYGIGGDPRGAQARPATGWYALTPTELRVARMVASGLSNPDIATELYLSRRTVQTHVSHILAKLDLRSRREVSELARSLDVPA